MANINLFSALIILSSFSASYGSKIVCYYNNQAYWRKDVARTKLEHLKLALPHCDYLVYGYIGINDFTYNVTSLDPVLDLEGGKNYFEYVTGLKEVFPHLKILVSVGGYADYSITRKYLTLLDKDSRRINFIESLLKLVRFGFDGADLAWQFPVHKELKPLTPSGKIWSTVSKYALFFLDDFKEKEHKEAFTLLCKELNAALRKYNKILTLSILPNVNYRSYYDIDSIKDDVEQIHLLAYDYKTPRKLPSEADYSTPMYYVQGRDPIENVNYTVEWFLNSTIPHEKIILGVPTHSNAWKMTTLSGDDPSPPVLADGPADPGPVLKEEGIMAYYELCGSFTKDALLPLTSVSDVYGVYAYNLPKHFWQVGVWVSYECKQTVATKAEYVKKKGLGGMAIVDLSLDDFRGLCDDPLQSFPILKTAKNSIKGEVIVDVRMPTEVEKITQQVTQASSSPPPVA